MEHVNSQVDDKYQYSCDNKDIQVHGWISPEQGTGFWQITPSFEYRTGRPVKQNLTSHVGPTSLSVFISAHYAGDPLVPKFDEGEPWKKVFGPVFIYCNSLPKEADWHLLWEDAKQQMMVESENWPYEFPASEDFPTSDQRGNFSGRLIVQDRWSVCGISIARGAGSRQTECKGYQFWTKADEDGYFSISGIREGDYSLYAWVPGYIGDYKCDLGITITANLGMYILDMPASDIFFAQNMLASKFLWFSQK